MREFAQRRVHESQIVTTRTEMAADGWALDFILVIPPNEYTMLFGRETPERVEAPAAPAVRAVPPRGKK